MKIVVRRKVGKGKTLVLPSGLVWNPFAAGLARKSLRKYGIHITKKQANSFVKELSRYHRRHPDWALVEVESTEGDIVNIVL